MFCTRNLLLQKTGKNDTDSDALSLRGLMKNWLFSELIFSRLERFAIFFSVLRPGTVKCLNGQKLPKQMDHNIYEYFLRVLVKVV